MKKKFLEVIPSTSDGNFYFACKDGTHVVTGWFLSDKQKSQLYEFDTDRPISEPIISASNNSIPLTVEVLTELKQSGYSLADIIKLRQEKVL